ncbi:43574_t:CDS:1 [Gigaspora margarita]|uniref:43574_t:CDS:1 n=1 Tax=Gigaspora margarita TaxID=4874 RepID=A0ABN7UM67_GIGMA|nr:43574_t:CDS:1 [Gigaspora margarita]
MAEKNYQNSIDPKVKIPSFTGSLFNWRPKAVKAPDESRNQNNITVTDLNKELKNHTIKAIIKVVIMDFLSEYLSYNKLEFSERSYILRVLDSLRTGRPFIEPHTFFCCIIFILYAFLAFSIMWNFSCIIFGIILKPLLSDNVNKNKNREVSKSFKTNLKKWLIDTIFNMKPLMGVPYFSTGPRDLWSNQWHQIYQEIFKELGYNPIQNYFKHNKFLGRILGIYSAFLISGLFHEYISIVAFNHFSLDYITFFLFHGIFFILWETVENKILERENKILERGKDFEENFGTKVFKMVLFLPIAAFTTPLFAEPYIKRLNYYSNLYIYKNLRKWTNKNCH